METQCHIARLARASVAPSILLALTLGVYAVATPAAAQIPLSDQAESTQRTACTLAPGPTRAVAKVIDAETILLDDNTEVRLIGALAPRRPDESADLAYWPPERDAKAELERLVLGKSVTLAFSGRRADRYGRTLAQVLVEPTATEAEAEPGAERTWVQGHMLARGHARAYALKDNTGCLRELSAHEAMARRAGLGLWSNAAYQSRDAARAWELTRLRSTFQIVEGEVTGLIEGRTVLILRFDRNAPDEIPLAVAGEDAKPPTRGFSLALKPQIVRSLATTGLTLANLKGRRLRIHGWIERRGGPSIDIVDPHQIEIVDEIISPANAAEVMPAKRRRTRKGMQEAAALTKTAN